MIKNQHIEKVTPRLGFHPFTVNPKAFITKKHNHNDCAFNAEEEGFEPPVPRGTTVFKTAAFDHSATPLGQVKHLFAQRECKCKRYLFHSKWLEIFFDKKINLIPHLPSYELDGYWH